MVDHDRDVYSNLVVEINLKYEHEIENGLCNSRDSPKTSIRRPNALHTISTVSFQCPNYSTSSNLLHILRGIGPGDKLNVS